MIERTDRSSITSCAAKRNRLPHTFQLKPTVRNFHHEVTKSTKNRKDVANGKMSTEHFFFDFFVLFVLFVVNFHRAGALS